MKPTVQMKHFLHLFILFFALTCMPSKSVSAQTVELLAGNTLNGALQGTLLGGATMALTNSTDFAPLRVGIGLGTLYGIGMGAYDISHGEGRELLVSGLFNDGNNSSVIVLLDTFYGAAIGSIIVTSVMLVANEPIIQGLQYGAGIGAWTGFGFGLFDTFVLAKRSLAPMTTAYALPTKASGLIGLSIDDKTSFGFINPSMHQRIEINQSDYFTTVQPTIELLNLRVNL